MEKDEILDRGDDFEDEDLENEEIEDEEDLEDLEDPEEDEEDLEDPEEDEDSEEDDEDSEEPEDDIKIPKSRLDQVIAQREEERDRVAWLEDQLEKLISQKQEPIKEEPKEPPFDFDAAEEEYASLLIEGETSKATLIRSKIDKEHRKEILSIVEDIKNSSLNEASSKSAEAVEDSKFSDLVIGFEEKYSFLNDDSDDYNEEAVETVNTLLSGYMASGKTKTESLKLAVRKVTPMYIKEDKPSLANSRKTSARKKSARASNAQPPKSRSKSVSNKDLDTVDISKLSERDFDKLTAKEKRILRGD